MTSALLASLLLMAAGACMGVGLVTFIAGWVALLVLDDPDQ